MRRLSIDGRIPFQVAIAHSIMRGSAWERTPWHATQRAAWDALTKASLYG
jgi:hypothetical protein